MADKEISGLTAAAVLDGTELIIISQGGNSRKSTVAAVGGSLPLVPSGAAGTGSFTPTNIAKSAPNMMQLRVGGCYLFRFDDAGAWETRWGFYTGSVITRPTNGFVASSTGSGLTLSANAVASVLSPVGLFQRGMGEMVTQIVPPLNTTLSVLGFGASSTGTAAAGTFADTNLLTRQAKVQYTSATTASAGSDVRVASGVASRNAGLHFNTRFGVSTLPTAPRCAVGVTVSQAALAADPSSLTDVAMFAKDSADTNIQMMVNDSSGSATKQDTSIALAINVLYEACVWCDPAGTTVYGLLIDYTNQALWYGTAVANLPTAATFLAPRVSVTLNGTDTGTAAVLQFCGMYLRIGA